ncbi:hypothetical protein PTKIN_Ptkin08bG0133300 [Pterospermum kingtungense]
MVFYPSQILDDEITITPASDVYAEGRDHWNKSFVTQFIGKVPNLSYIERMLKQLWGSDGITKFIPAGENLFIFQFPTAAARDKVLELGPWNVPLELFTLMGLSYIASGIGNPLYMDRFTANRELVAYAKVCVENDVSKPISKKLFVRLEDGVKKWVPKVNKTVIVEHAVNVVKKDSAGGNANVQGKSSSVARFFVLANEADEVISINKPSIVTDLMNDIKAKVQDTMRKLEVDKRKVALAECVTVVTQDQSCSIKGSLSVDKGKESFMWVRLWMRLMRLILTLILKLI